MQKTAQSIQRSLIYMLVTAWLTISGSVLDPAQGASTALHPAEENQQSQGLRFQSSLNSDWRFKRQADSGAATTAGGNALTGNKVSKAESMAAIESDWRQDLCIFSSQARGYGLDVCYQLGRQDPKRLGTTARQQSRPNKE